LFKREGGSRELQFGIDGSAVEIEKHSALIHRVSMGGERNRGEIKWQDGMNEAP
jgi:hypothetical protein